MNEQPLNLRRAAQILRRHLVLVVVATALGLALGAGYTLSKPPLHESEALVVVSSSVRDTPTQLVIARSDPVLAGAVRADPGTSLEQMRSRIRVSSLAYNVISFSAHGKTEAAAKRIANAVVRSYVAYLASGRLPGKIVQAQVLQPAADATTASPLPIRLLGTGGLGALLGAMVGAIVVLRRSRSDRRLHARDEMAETIGVPVLASIPVSHPSDVAGWRALLERYEPGPVDRWRMSTVLEHLVRGSAAEGAAAGSSLAVLSLSHDGKALAVGPQIAVFAASLGIPTELVIGPQQDTNATATLRAACAASPPPASLPKELRVTVRDDGDTDRAPDAALTVVVAVVDGRSPKFTGTMRTAATVLSVSAGAATGEQLARVAASAAADRRHIDAILVADPDPADRTTGRIVPFARPVRREGLQHTDDTATGA